MFPAKLLYFSVKEEKMELTPPLWCQNFAHTLCHTATLQHHTDATEGK